MLSLVRGPWLARLTRPGGRWDDLATGLTAGSAASFILLIFAVPVWSVMLGVVWSRDDLTFLGESAGLEPKPGARAPAADRLAERYSDLLAARPKHRGRYLAYKIQADGVSGQVAGAGLGLATALSLGLAVSLAESFYAGPLLRNRGRVPAMFPAFAELMVPTLGAIYSAMAIPTSLALADPAEAAEACTFFLLCTLLSLGLLAPAVYMTWRGISWPTRWLFYAIAGICLLLIALSAYE
jgi:hypothetical protein